MYRGRCVDERSLSENSGLPGDLKWIYIGEQPDQQEIGPIRSLYCPACSVSQRLPVARFQASRTASLMSCHASFPRS
jgi:hypothetical protein